ncbi:MAG: cytidylate kinase-like family protein [Thermodesulfobacteriota bacterium]|nr:cytidylate kinase-like family protein [Thermodesulfobacteriota bacterium]
MANDIRTDYFPGKYKKSRPTLSKMVDRYVREWEMRKTFEKDEAKKAPELTHYISISRKIGVGALEIADILSERIGRQVVDREIMEHIAKSRDLRATTVDYFDERYPGRLNEFALLMFGEKAFTMGDYMRQLANTVIRIAETGPAIFVGRGTHLILPREKVLAVRFICSTENRIKRVADIMKIGEADAAKVLEKEDKLQRDFFKKNFARKDALPYEFDFVINRDYFPDAHWAASIIEKAYRLKFNVS